MQKFVYDRTLHDELRLDSSFSLAVSMVEVRKRGNENGNEMEESSGNGGYELRHREHTKPCEIQDQMRPRSLVV